MEHKIKHWYILLIVGIIFLFLGIYTLVTPESAFTTLAIIFSLAFLIAGVVEMVFAITNKKTLETWGKTLTMGLITFLIGLLLVLNPDVSKAVLAIYIGIAILIRSISAFAYALSSRGNASNRFWLGFGGILGIIASFFLLLNPALLGLGIVLLTGIAFIIGGLFSVIQSLRFRSMKRSTT